MVNNLRFVLGGANLDDHVRVAAAVAVHGDQVSTFDNYVDVKCQLQMNKVESCPEITHFWSQGSSIEQTSNSEGTTRLFVEDNEVVISQWQQHSTMGHK